MCKLQIFNFIHWHMLNQNIKYGGFWHPMCNPTFQILTLASIAGVPVHQKTLSIEPINIVDDRKRFNRNSFTYFWYTNVCMRRYNLQFTLDNSLQQLVGWLSFVDYYYYSFSILISFYFICNAININCLCRQFVRMPNIWRSDAFAISQPQQ